MITYSIIQKSQLEGALRLDAEYYQLEYLDVEKKLNAVKTKFLEDLAESILSFGAYSLTSNIEWQDKGIPYLNVGDIYDGYINYSDVKHISERVDEILQKSRIREGDVVLTMAGTIGNAAVTYNIKSDHINGNQAIAKIKLKEGLSPYYLVAFLNSKYGQLQIRREIVSSVQANIFLGQIKKLKIPVFDTNVIKKTGSLYLGFLKEIENSKSLYQQAENLLLEELGLKNFSEEENLSSVINLSDIKSAHRMDAEYFQSRYDKLIRKIKNNSKKLEIFIKSYSTGFPYKSENYQEAGTPLIRINNIKKGVLDLNDTAYLSEKDCKISLKDEAKSGDIVLSMSGTIGVSAIIPDDILKSYVNQRILKFTSKDINRDYLVLLLNSIVGLYQLERIGTGGVQINISYKDIKNILIPILPEKTQQKIADLVRQSHEARKKAKELLEEAKRKVEELIEK